MSDIRHLHVKVLLTFMMDYIQCFKLCSKRMNKRHFKIKYTRITLKHLHVNERVLLMTLISVCLDVWPCYHNQQISQLTAWPTLLKLQKICDILYMCMGIDVPGGTLKSSTYIYHCLLRYIVCIMKVLLKLVC